MLTLDRNGGKVILSMTSPSLTLEQIAAQLHKVELAPMTSSPNGSRSTDRKLVEGKAQTALRNRFGEVVEAFQRCKTVKAVSDEVNLSEYCIRRYFFGNPEFCELLRATNENIFLEATKAIRDNNKAFIEKAQRLAEEALDAMEQLLNESESEHIRFKVAQDLLDRDPRLSRTKKVESTGMNIVFEAKTLALAMEAAQEIEVRDVTPRSEAK